jgi:hypothetical protein
MRILFFMLWSLVCLSVAGQPGSFPQSWVGNWQGELKWYKTGKPEPQKVNMELRIQPGDTAGQYRWQLIYGSETQDNRPYLLQPKDADKGHWVIDEGNGIVLDQFWTGNGLCGAFTVMGNTILNNYRMENDQLLVEFFSIGAKPMATTGHGTEESPAVDSYRVGSYQKAVLRRKKG